MQTVCKQDHFTCYKQHLCISVILPLISVGNGIVISFLYIQKYFFWEMQFYTNYLFCQHNEETYLINIIGNAQHLLHWMCFQSAYWQHIEFVAIQYPLKVTSACSAAHNTSKSSQVRVLFMLTLVVDYGPVVWQDWHTTLKKRWHLIFLNKYVFVSDWHWLWLQ